MQYLYVAIGGALGSVARYALTHWAGERFATGFPLGTLTVNVIGSFLMGVLIGLLARFLPENQSEIRLFVAVGILGGFTTFSAFSLDVVTLLERGETASALLYALVSVTLSVAGLFAGLLLLRAFA